MRLTGPSPDNLQQRATRDTAPLGSPCRERLRSCGTGTNSESTRQPCRGPCHCPRDASAAVTSPKAAVQCQRKAWEGVWEVSSSVVLGTYHADPAGLRVGAGGSVAKHNANCAGSGFSSSQRGIAVFDGGATDPCGSPHLLENTACLLGLSKLTYTRTGCVSLDISGTEDHRAVRPGKGSLADALLGSSMLLMNGLTMAASRSTTNSKPSADTRVMYLLGSWKSISSLCQRRVSLV